MKKVTDSTIKEYIEGALLRLSLGQVLQVLESMGANIKHEFHGYHSWVLNLASEGDFHIFSLSESNNVEKQMCDLFYYEH